MEKKTMDSLVLELLEKVEKKKEEIKNAKKKPQWITNCSFQYENKHINIQTIRSKEKLVEICALIICNKKEKEEAAKLLDIEYSYSFSGYTDTEWIKDLRTRVKMLSIEDKEKELEELDKRINKLVTSEQRRAMELEQLQKLLD